LAQAVAKTSQVSSASDFYPVAWASRFLYIRDRPFHDWSFGCCV